MDYEKAYKDALEKARFLRQQAAAVGDPLMANRYEQIFPQLAESEDEKTRKDLVEFVLYKAGCLLDEETEHRFIKYLEKQKINTEGDFGRGYNCGYECCLNSHGAEWFGKQKDQKPVEWSEEDEEKLNWCINLVISQDSLSSEWQKEVLDWLQSIRPQPHTVSVENAIKFDNLEYERGVKDGIQHSENHHWKPSEVQMMILRWAANGMVDESIAAPEMRAVLRELYNDLKKL